MPDLTLDRVSIDGYRRLACQTLCQDGMRVETRP